MTEAPVTPVMPADVLRFWFDAGPARWFKKDAAFDAAIAARFGAVAEAAARGALDTWATDPDGALALLLLLDQFRRNIHRESAKAFAADRHCLSIAVAAIARGFDAAVAKDRRQWFYLPFEHSEDLRTQECGIALFEALGDPEALKWAVLHRDIIARFGRFPHRNAVLGRQSSPEELQFLADGGFTG